MDGINVQGKIARSLANFLAITEKYITESTEPGDYYKAVWCRDAAYILRDQFVTGNHTEAFSQLKHIWKNQIGSDSNNLVYGRGSPKTEFTPLKASKETIKNFCGALPTTIYDNFSEIYALNPDIDSTALMIYVSSWILVQTINQIDGKSKNKSGQISEMISFILPYLFRSVDYLLSRDEDNDGLLEQEYNEDWMDTVLRNGKVVYSQGCWLLALSGFANLLNLIDKEEEARRIQSIAARLINSIESKMWSEKSKCYVNIDSSKTTGNGSSEILYQDFIFYVFAMTEQLIDTPFVTYNNNNNNNNLKNVSTKNISTEAEKKGSLNRRYYYEKIQKRMILALESLRKRIWVRNIPLVTEKPLQKTGPWILQSNEYHNYTYWPWITAMELLTRFRFGQISECTILLSNLLYADPNNNSNHDRIFYEWLDSRTLKGGGAYPFRTGISAFRVASFEILSKFT
jgi:glycogen debranching enzyme